MRDLNKYQERAIALRAAILADGAAWSLPVPAKFLRICHVRGKSEGASFFEVTLPNLGRALDLGLVTGLFQPIPGFRSRIDTTLPDCLFELFEQVFRKDGRLLHAPCPFSIRVLRQLLLVDGKVLRPHTRLQEHDAWVGFRNRMEQMCSQRFPKNHPMFIAARAALGKALKGLDLSNITPGHGPGAVAEGYDRFERWVFTSWPRKAEAKYPYLTYGTPSILASLSSGQGITLSRVSTTRVVLVPKDWRGPRLISVEPAVMQYLQQGQMRAIAKFVDRSPILRRSISLADQTLSRRDAQYAYELNRATVDLSNASDNVAATLVWWLLGDHPDIRGYLFRTRSDFASFKGMRCRLGAFAPMGSATCFPIECLVFWAFAVASVQQTYPRGCSLRTAASQVRVYGDDVIIPGHALEYFLFMLRESGMEPNMSKTCWSTPFRESCGGDFFNGEPVSIIRNKSLHYEKHWAYGQIPHLASLQRNFFRLGYTQVSELLCKWAREIMPICSVYPCFSDPEEEFFRHPYFFSNHPSLDDGVRVRWRRSLQRVEVRWPTFFNESRPWPAALEWPRLHARLLGDSIERTVRRDRKVKRTWLDYPGYVGLTTVRPA